MPSQKKTAFPLSEIYPEAEMHNAGQRIGSHKPPPTAPESSLRWSNYFFKRPADAARSSTQMISWSFRRKT